MCKARAWYRLHFEAPPARAGSRAFLQFDGVATIADVLAERALSRETRRRVRALRFDASAAIHPAGDNLLVVRADNSKPAPGSTTQNVVPLSGDFFMFGGLYRNVSLIVTDPVHVDMLDFGGPGVYAHATAIDSSSATVDVTSRLANDASAPRKAIVETSIADANGNVVATTKSTLALPAKVSTTHVALRVPHPHLWNGVADPYLYKVAVVLRSKDGEVLDSVEQPLGFAPDLGFFLNGEHLFPEGESRGIKTAR